MHDCIKQDAQEATNKPETWKGSGLMHVLFTPNFWLLFPRTVQSEDTSVLKVKAWDAQSGPTLCNPTDCSPQSSSVHGIVQARTRGWAAISFSRGSSWARSPAPWADSLPSEPRGKPFYARVSAKTPFPRRPLITRVKWVLLHYSPAWAPCFIVIIKWLTSRFIGLLYRSRSFMSHVPICLMFHCLHST